MPVSRTKLLRAYNALADTLTPHQQYGVLAFFCEVLDRTYTKTEILPWAEQVRTREGAGGKFPLVER
jgi:cytochrome c oxidase assembly factor CtaG